jgi:uncharacterized protein involved in exopolysaccharide biosynthesis
MNKSNHKNLSDEGMPKLTVRDALTPLFRHKRLVIATFCCVAVLGILVAWLWAAQYHVAEMQVVVEEGRSDAAVTSAQNAAVMSGKSVTTDQITSEIALLRGLDMLRSVAATCGLADTPSLTDVFLPRDSSRRKAIKLEKAAVGLEKKLVIEQEKTSDVINVKYGSTANPEVPACVLQTLGKRYLEKHLQLRRPAGSSDFFSQQTEQSQRALQSAETRLANFSRDAGVAAPDLLRSDMAQQVANSEFSLSQAQQAIKADEQRIKNVEVQLATMSPMMSTEEVSNSANILLQQLQATLLAAQEKRVQLLLKYDPSYPLVREADQEITDTQAVIAKAQDLQFVNKTTSSDPTYEFLRQDMAKTQADLAAQRAMANTLAGNIRNMRLQMVDLDGKAVQQGALIREAKADENNYLLYLNKREQERTSDALDKDRIADVEIAVPAIVPLLPAHGPFLVMFIGLVLATISGVGVGYLAEYADPSFRTPGEVVQTLSIPVLASLPRKVA